MDFLAAEYQHVPHPGSRLDAGTRDHAPHPDAVQAIQGTLPGPEPYHPIPTQAERAQETIWRTMSVAASGIRQLLPQDPGRYRALIISVDQDIVITEAKELAQETANTATNVPYPQGFYLPKGILVPVESRGLAWVANTSTTAATRVSVMTERYADSPAD